MNITKLIGLSLLSILLLSVSCNKNYNSNNETKKSNTEQQTPISQESTSTLPVQNISTSTELIKIISSTTGVKAVDGNKDTKKNQTQSVPEQIITNQLPSIQSATGTISIIDQCPNLAYDQQVVPYGMTKYPNGECFYPADDKCQNIENFQGQVPEGYTRNYTSGNCSPIPPDPASLPIISTDTGEIRCFGYTDIIPKIYSISVGCRNTYDHTSVKLTAVYLKSNNQVSNIIVKEADIPTYTGEINQIDNSGLVAFYYKKINLASGNLLSKTNNQTFFTVESSVFVNLWKISYILNGQQRELIFHWDDTTKGFLQSN